jgi:lipoprotein-anchoring transpeptidase ErfK/SrfK
MRTVFCLLLAVSCLLAAAPAAAGRPAWAPPPRAPARSALARRVFTLVDGDAGVVVRARPDGRVLGTLPGRTPLGTTTWLWALRTTPDRRWADVVLPWRPNGRTGWIALRGRRIVHTRYWVRADLSARRVALMSGAGVVRSFPAAVGAPSSPTPTGRFSVTDPIATGDPGGPFGWFAFGLSGHQPRLPAGWTGGDQLAIHGTDAPWTIGTAASAGCLRVSAAALVVLRRHLRPGTPVVIVD